ncbi:uncharacterized protein LOC122034679 [Zingiber officinale]|uniref:Uncharacterized protein n=1 Tax=Zingiber officinale TaxID=94328 RepID=A0A8J5IBP0_ZINOF|nr:uncharacterized protein LOC122034679 [Zingiber officinale]KAG6531184.1 hypothetical protein ZIOFF_004958 [Zingiber officinale]
MEDTMNRRHHYIPAFGNWDYSSDLPITQYFESAMQAGLVRGHVHGEEPSYDDLFRASHSMKRRQQQEAPWTRKAKRGDQKQQQQVQQREQERKQGKVYDAVAAQARPRRAPMAVDEDLYKIPPELLHNKPRRAKSLWSGCLRLNCIA